MAAEAKLQAKILKYLRAKGVFCFKVSAVGRNGVPDIFALLREGRALFIEVKAPNGKPTALQEYTMARIRADGALCWLVRDFEEFRALAAHTF